MWRGCVCACTCVCVCVYTCVCVSRVCGEPVSRVVTEVNRISPAEFLVPSLSNPSVLAIVNVRPLSHLAHHKFQKATHKISLEAHTYTHAKYSQIMHVLTRTHTKHTKPTHTSHTHTHTIHTHTYHTHTHNTHT